MVSTIRLGGKSKPVFPRHSETLPKAMSQARSRAWCFTLNNYTDAHIQHIAEHQDDFRYCIFGKEVGEETHTPHLQGYVYFKNPVRMASVKLSVGNSAHVAIARGNTEQNITYCSKGGDVTVHGEAPMSQEDKGKKEKLRYEEAYAAAEEGRMDDIDADLRVRHYSTLKRIRLDKLNEQELADTTETMHWFCGPAGTGKSRRARHEWPELFIKPINKWWDGYTHEETVLLDDFDKNHSVLCHHLKIWADRYPFRAEVKGGTVMIRPKRIIVTSNWTPEEIWALDQDLQPILRRFKVTRFEAEWTPPPVMPAEGVMHDSDGDSDTEDYNGPNPNAVVDLSQSL